MTKKNRKNKLKEHRKTSEWSHKNHKSSSYGVWQKVDRMDPHRTGFRRFAQLEAIKNGAVIFLPLGGNNKKSYLYEKD